MGEKTQLAGSEDIYSRKILTQLIVLGVAIIVVGVWQSDFLSQIYLKNQITHVGWFINGGILILFLAGIFHIVREFQRLSGEELAISRVLENLEAGSAPTEGAEASSLIVRRYLALEDLHRQHAVINHSALAATLVALHTVRRTLRRWPQPRAAPRPRRPC